MLLFSALVHLALVGVMITGWRIFPQKTRNATVYMVRVVESVPRPRVEEALIPRPSQTKETQEGKERSIALQEARKKVSKREEMEALRERMARRKEAESRELAEERRRLQAWREELETKKTIEIVTSPEVSLGWRVSQFPSWYVDLIRNRAFENWDPPAGTVRQEACVLFEIYRDGRIGNIAMEKPSQDATFDQSALLAVEKLEPLPPLPGEFAGDSLRVHLTFRQED